MTDAEVARRGWLGSAPGWIEQIDKGDVNRTCLLDAPMLDLAGNVAGLDVVDVGCGEGRFCRMLAERGGRTVGVDPTGPLLREARARHREGTYVEAGAERLPFRDEAFDLAISYLMLIDVADFRAAIREMARILRPGGRLAVANLNPFATTRSPAWYRNERGEKLHVAVEDYFTERPVRQEWAKISILNWHRPMEAYMAAFLEAGLLLRAFREPRPAPEDVARHPNMRDEYLVPLFHTMLWEKPGR